MKLKTIKLFIAVLCVLLLGVGNAMAGTLKVAKDGLEEYEIYDSDVTDIRLPNQVTIDGKSTGTLSYNSNAHKLTFNNVHRTSSLLIKNGWRTFFLYDNTTPLTIELVGDNELTVEQAFSMYARLFFGNIKIVGDGSLKLNLKSSHSGNTSYLRVVDGDVDMQGTGVVEMTLSNYNRLDYNYTYAATGVKLQEGMMLSNSSYTITTTKETELIQYVYRKNGGLNFDRSGNNAIWLRIEPLKKYNLYIAGQQVNWINMKDVLGDGGSVSYDPANNQVILDDADINYEFNGSGDKTSIFEHSDQNDPTNHVAGVHPNIVDVKLIGSNKITGVVNSPLNSTTPFFGFPKMARFFGDGTLRMELSANANAAGGVYGFGTLGAITGNTVVLQDSFAGWVSVSTSNVGTNPASVFMNNARYLVLPDNSTYTDYFIASGNTLPVVARTNVARQNKDLNVAHVNFGKKDGSAAPTGTITPPLIQTAYVGKTLADKTLGLEVTGGQAPFYYSATGLQDGLSINPENGYVSGTYTTANTPASDAKSTLTVTDFQGRQSSVSVARQVVAEKLTINDSDSEILTLKPKWAEGVAIEQIDLSKKFSGGKAPYTYYALSATLNQGRTTLPTGVSFDKSTGVISGTPTERMEYNYGIVVEDCVGQKVLFNVQGNVAENYGFSVIGVPVTGLNKNNILQGRGVISYEPETEMLVFDNAQVNSTTAAHPYFVDKKISKIKVNGENLIRYIGPVDGVSVSYGFPGDLEIYGDGQLILMSYNSKAEESYAVNGNVTVMENATIDFSSMPAINGNLTVPANQAIYTDFANKGNWVRRDGTTENVANYRHVKTEILANGALGFSNKKESKTIYNTVPVKPFTMFDVVGGEAPYRYSATSLPSGLVIDAKTGYISGTSTLGSKNATVNFTVTDAMGREVSIDMNLTLKDPTLNLTKCGGSRDEHFDVSSWTTAANTSLEEGQILLVKSNFDIDETAIGVPKNIVLRDVNGKMLAGDIDLKDGVKYAFPYEVEAQSIRYTRSFAEKYAGNLQCFYVPFDVEVTDELLKDFTFYKLYMVSQKDENNNGEIESDEPLVMMLSKVYSGKILRANTPYYVRPKAASTLNVTAYNTTLRAAENGSITCSTMEQEYTLTGIYETTNINGFYTMSAKGNFSHYTKDTNLGSFRWYMDIKNRSDVDGDMANYARPIEIYIDGEDDTTGIVVLQNEVSVPESGRVYTLDGRQVTDIDNLSSGIYIINGKKVVKK